MKIALAQQNYHIGNFESNIKKIIAGIEAAKNQEQNWSFFPNCVYAPSSKRFLSLKILLINVTRLLKDKTAHYRYRSDHRFAGAQ